MGNASCGSFFAVATFIGAFLPFPGKLPKAFQKPWEVLHETMEGFSGMLLNFSEKFVELAIPIEGQGFALLPDAGA